jgi:hypothetical protein
MRDTVAGPALENLAETGLPTRVIAYAWGEKYLGDLLSFTLPALLALRIFLFSQPTCPASSSCSPKSGSFRTSAPHLWSPGSAQSALSDRPSACQNADEAAMAQRQIRGGGPASLRQRVRGRASIGRYLDFYKRASQHPSVYVIEENRLC